MNNVYSKAIPLIKKYFGKSTELAKEFDLYQTLVKEKFTKENKATQLIEAVLEARTKLNQASLNRQKYNLIKEIKSSYVLEDFFKAKVNNYKILASVYKLFEYTVSDNPVEIVDNKDSIVEHITLKDVKKNSALNEMKAFEAQDKEVRLLSYKILIDKFNTKYSKLNEGQKSLLRQYINSVNDSSELKTFLVTEVSKIQKDLKTLNTKVTDKVTKIKLSEVTNLLNTYKDVKVVKDNHVLNLLRYHELIKELKKS